MSTIKTTLTLDEVKQKYHSSEWDAIAVTIKDVKTIIAVKCPNKAIIQRLVDDSSNPKNSVTANINLVKSCLLTHSPSEFDELVDQKPGIIAKLTEKISALTSTDIEDVKKD